MNKDVFSEPSIEVLPLNETDGAQLTSVSEDWGGGEIPWGIPRI